MLSACFSVRICSGSLIKALRGYLMCKCNINVTVLYPSFSPDSSGHTEAMHCWAHIRIYTKDFISHIYSWIFGLALPCTHQMSSLPSLSSSFLLPDAWRLRGHGGDKNPVCVSWIYSFVHGRCIGKLSHLSGSFTGCWNLSWLPQCRESSRLTAR